MRAALESGDPRSAGHAARDFESLDEAGERFGIPKTAMSGTTPVYSSAARQLWAWKPLGGRAVDLETGHRKGRDDAGSAPYPSALAQAMDRRLAHAETVADLMRVDLSEESISPGALGLRIEQMIVASRPFGEALGESSGEALAARCGIVTEAGRQALAARPRPSTRLSRPRSPR